MGEGLTLNAIDECDLFFLLDLIVYRANKQPEPEMTTIDQIF
ncbi:MAG TPA: hypothetical protein VN374_06085 [Desulfitobacteriaceae bacterium]|nr:hypothetical protein [Desulfitobacteriaceae bacterium]